MAENVTETVEATTDDLDAFEKLWNGEAQEAKPAEEIKEEENVEAPEDTEEGVEEIDADDDTADDSSATEEEEVEKPKGKKKSSVQERIDELTKNWREAERKLEALEKERQESKNKEKEPEGNTSETSDSKIPDPSDRTKYPLGDLDPQYSQDMLDYKLEQRLAELDAKREQDRIAEATRQKAEALQETWNAKLETAPETYEDFQEKIQTLEQSMAGLDEQRGAFLAETIMQMDKGVDVLYYLATNPEAAEAISKSSPVNAALALGRLEAMFDDKEPVKKVVKASNAPTPPAQLNKGNKVTTTVRPDTDDLDAFEDVFFSRKK